jgi:SAM-dependent methyltransferase
MGLLNKLVPTSLKVKLRHRFMRGDAVYCPICGNSGIAFLPSGDPPRPHAQCAFCGSLERARMAWLYLKRLGLPKAGTRVLHVAPENCLRERFKSVPGVEYIAGDKFDPGYRWASETIRLDVTEIPFPDEHFDLIICSHVLEHVPDDRKAIAELHRVMKKGGLGLLIVPFEANRETTYEDFTINTPEGRRKAFGQHDHVRIYGRDYSDRLTEAGFKVEVVDLSSETSHREYFRLGMSREQMHVVRS